jgi:hypothetical protein
MILPLSSDLDNFVAPASLFFARAHPYELEPSPQILHVALIS